MSDAELVDEIRSALSCVERDARDLPSVIVKHVTTDVLQFHPADCQCPTCEAKPVYYVPLGCPRDPQQEYREWLERMQRVTRLWNKQREWAEQGDPWLVIERLYPGRPTKPLANDEDLK